MKNLAPMNSQTWFCKCGMGPADSCNAPHVSELSRAGSPARHYFLIASIAVVAIIVFVFTLGSR